MITVSIAGEPIDISQSASFTIGARSPYTAPGELYGPKVYNIAALDTRRNARIFQFAGLLGNTSRTRTYADAEIRLGDLLWKVGTLRLRDFNGAYNLSFHTDAGDIQTRIQDRKLTDLDLGTAPRDLNVSDTYPAANHVYFTVKNPDFYANEDFPDFVGYVNLYDQDTSRLYNPVDDGVNYAISPFPFLLYIMDQVFRSMGYRGIEGDWTQDAKIQKVVICSNHSQGAGSIVYSQLVPPVSVGSFLIDTAIFFGITYIVDPLTRMVRIERIRDWISDPAYTDLNHRANRGYKLEPNDSDGILFRMEPDSEDDSLDPYPQYFEHRIGNGARQVITQASHLLNVSEVSPYGGDWTVSQMRQPASGPGLSVLETRGQLRFMIFDGMRTDSLGHSFPDGKYDTPTFSLLWTKFWGIIPQNYVEWIDWIGYREYTERTVELSLVELLQLDTGRKVMIDNLKWIIDEYEASISPDSKADRIKTRLKLYSVKL